MLSRVLLWLNAISEVVNYSNNEKGKELSYFERGFVIGCHISVKSTRAVATELSQARSTVGDIMKKWKTTLVRIRIALADRPRILTKTFTDSYGLEETTTNHE